MLIEVSVSNVQVAIFLSPQSVLAGISHLVDTIRHVHRIIGDRIHLLLRALLVVVCVN